MKKKEFCTGIAKYFRPKGNRYTLILDNVKISNKVKKSIDKSIAQRKTDPFVTRKKYNDYIRNKKIIVTFK